MWTFLLAGAMAGLAGAVIVQGRDHALLHDFSAHFGYIGIGVALVARLNPINITPSMPIFKIPESSGGRRSVSVSRRDNRCDFCGVPYGLWSD